MMENKILIQRYTQNNQNFISFLIDFKTLYRTSKVLVYGESKYGYQRKADKNHYLKIKKYLLSDEKAILPSSIILGVDEDKMQQYCVQVGGNTFLNLEGIEEEIFRIIDGQHRLKGLEEAVKVKPELENFVFNAVVVESKIAERSKELSIFTDINSKSKRIRVDLALLAKYNYEIYEGKIEKLGEHIAVKTAYKLNENPDERNIWRNGIKFDIHEEKALGIVSINAFKHAIKPICDKYLRDMDFNMEKSTDEDKYLMAESASDFIVKLLIEAWTIVAEKWGGCFAPAVENDYFYDMKEYFYNRKYYIQKTLGVQVLSSILYDSIRHHKINKYNLGQFYRTIIASSINIANWSTGDIFAGLSSEAGFKLAKNYILNKEIVQ